MYELVDWQDLFTHEWMEAIGSIAGALAGAFAAWVSVLIAKSVRDEQRKRDAAEAEVLLRLIVPEVSVFAGILRPTARNLALALGDRRDSIADATALQTILKGLSEEHHHYLSEAHQRLTLLPRPLGADLAALLSGAQTIQRLARMLVDGGLLPNVQIHDVVGRLREFLEREASQHIAIANKCRAAIKQPLIPTED